MIPKQIHTLLYDNYPSHVMRKRNEKISFFYADWKHKIWTYEELKEEMKKLSCIYLFWNRFDYKKQIETGKYALLYLYGGLYIDLYAYPKKEQNFDYCLTLFRSRKKFQYLTSDVIFSPAQEPFCLYVLKKICLESSSWDRIISWSGLFSGSLLLQRCYENWLKKGQTPIQVKYNKSFILLDAPIFSVKQAIYLSLIIISPLILYLFWYNPFSFLKRLDWIIFFLWAWATIVVIAIVKE